MDPRTAEHSPASDDAPPSHLPAPSFVLPIPVIPVVPVTVPATAAPPVSSSVSIVSPPPKKRKRGSKRLQPLILTDDVCRALANAVKSAPSPEAAILHLMHFYDFDMALLNRALASISPFSLCFSRIV